MNNTEYARALAQIGKPDLIATLCAIIGVLYQQDGYLNENKQWDDNTLDEIADVLRSSPVYPFSPPIALPGHRKLVIFKGASNYYWEFMVSGRWYAGRARTKWVARREAIAALRVMFSGLSASKMYTLNRAIGKDGKLGKSAKAHALWASISKGVLS
jgi:hypothetical protein